MGQASDAALNRFELLARALSGVVMAVAAVASVVVGGVLFILFVTGIALAAAREWHRLINGGRPQHGLTAEAVATGLAIVVAIVFAYARGSVIPPIVIVACGGLLAAATAAANRGAIFWHAFGALYIGVPALALVALRQGDSHGGWIVLGLFVAVWATDIGALLFGKLIGGPKLAPQLSPSKTWAGFVGGIAVAALAEALYVAVLGGEVTNALIFGAFLALVGHAGDLFESWVKRQFRAKNSGGMIPGHGGMLDRIDSLLFAAPVAAGLVFLAHLDPLFGVPW